MNLTCLDDDPRMERTLRRFAGQLGHGQEMHATSAAFKEDVLRHAPDLILLDLELGRETGLAVVQWLAEQGVRAPLVLLSGHGDELLDTARRRSPMCRGCINAGIDAACMVRDLPPLLADFVPPPAPAAQGQAILTDTPDSDGLAAQIAGGQVEPFFQPIVACDGRICDAEVLTRIRLSDGSVLGAGQARGSLRATPTEIKPLERLFERLLFATRWILAPIYLGMALILSVAQLDVALTTALVLLPGLRAPLARLAPWAALPALLIAVAAPEATLPLPGVLLGASLALDAAGRWVLGGVALLWLIGGWLAAERGCTSRTLDSHKAERLLGAMLVMSESLGLTVIAEGVETEAQRAWLCAAGVDRLQGYLFGAPMPLADVPVTFGRAAWANLARLYYALELGGSLAELDQAVFDAVIQDRVNLYTEKNILKWVEQQGRDAEAFGKTLNSFEVDLARGQPDLLLVDLDMPRLDGFQVIARARRLAPAMRIVAMSGDVILGMPTHVLSMSAHLGADACCLPTHLPR